MQMTLLHHKDAISRPKAVLTQVEIDGIGFLSHNQLVSAGSKQRSPMSVGSQFCPETDADTLVYSLIIFGIIGNF